ncbi:protein neprosin-like, partial [Malania oleifera]|uniref:protein neprosin-like n=1 Tax=Malania oleifera TaxID=397392 RepID=UPI0025AEA8FE
SFSDEIESRLKRVNKPAVKTIRTEYGDIYDCIDFYKQPAFDHPLLKNHNYHPQVRIMMPDFAPGSRKHRYVSTRNEQPYLAIKGEGCAVGTVPIRRVTKYAVVRTKRIPNKSYNGAGFIVTVFNPDVDVNQYSSGQIKIQNGRDIISAGWTVNPSAFGDSRTRAFFYFQASGRSGCFNTRCSGFVITNNTIHLDRVLQPSIINKEYYSTELKIHRNAAGDWWLLVGADHIPVGFYPAKLFTQLSEKANYIEWGGEVHGPTDLPSPPMGSSRLLSEIGRFDALCKEVTVFNELRQEVDPGDDIETYCDTAARYYGVADIGNMGSGLGRCVYFGGQVPARKKVSRAAAHKKSLIVTEISDGEDENDDFSDEDFKVEVEVGKNGGRRKQAVTNAKSAVAAT